MREKVQYGFMADSSFYRNPSGGRRYHLYGWKRLKSLCGLVTLLVEENPIPMKLLPDKIKCKKCIKKFTKDHPA